MKINASKFKSENKVLLSFIFFSVLSTLSNTVYNITDQIFIANTLGFEASSAIASCYPFSTLIVSLALLIGTGASIYVSKLLGENQKSKAQALLNNAFFWLFLSSILLALIIFIFLKNILQLIGISHGNFRDALTYSQFILLGYPFVIIGSGLSSLARADGNAKIAFYALFISGVIHIALNFILVVYFKIGVTGAAIATISSQLVCALIVSCYFIFKSNLRLNLKQIFSFSKSPLLSTLSSGLPSALLQLSYTFFQFLFLYKLNLLFPSNELYTSAFGVTNKLNSIFYAIAIGTSSGMLPLISRLIGQKNYKSAKKTFIKSSFIGGFSILSAYIIMLIFLPFLISVFTHGTADFIAFSSKFFIWFSLFSPLSILPVLLTSYLSAFNKIAQASLVAIIRQVILATAALILLPYFINPQKIYLTGAFIDISAFVICIFILIKVKFKLDLQT